MHNKILKYILPALAACFVFTNAKAEDDSQQTKQSQNDMKTGLIIRGGYAIGGTSPIPLPKEIRSIEAFTPMGGLALGIDGYRYYNKNWGLTAGIHLFSEGMYTEAKVKNYHMEISMGGETLEGNFTGINKTTNTMIGITVPLMATYRTGDRWTFRFGPYFSYHLRKKFDGSVYDGYLREGGPTGQKVIISKDNPATYDFSDNLRNAYWGLEANVDYRIYNRINVFALIDWSLTDAFKKNFTTITFPMYPIYATVGLAYYY